jgi:hypothetical protein
MYAASVENEAMGSQVVMFAELAYFNTTGPAAGASVATGASVAAASVASAVGASVAGAPPPHALNTSDNATNRERNKGIRFMGSPLFFFGDV